jgi:hypothetical protein
MFPNSFNKKNGKLIFENNISEKEEENYIFSQKYHHKKNDAIDDIISNDSSNNSDGECESDKEVDKFVPEFFNHCNDSEYELEKNEYNTDIFNYNYDINSLLNEDISKIKGNNNVFICIYSINDKSMYPFLNYFFVKNHFSNILEFPCIPILNESLFIQQLNIFLNYILNKKDVYLINGYKEFNNDTYLFVNVSMDNLIVDDKYSYLVLMDEITNSKQINDLKIDNKISDFFLGNSDFIYLKDMEEKPYEIPIVAYQGIEERLLLFTYIFGLSKSNVNEIMGPYFYFTNYQNVINKFNNIKNKYGIIRYALFLGSMKIPMNFIDDEIDRSVIKNELINISDNTKALLTMRISDHDGNWCKLYDSVYLGRTILDDETILSETPLWVIKNYEQQYSLSYKTIYNKIKIK